MRQSFTRRLGTLLRDAVAAINAYDGPLSVTLATGERAVDNDDAWLILQDDPAASPLVRDKREQRIRERCAREGIAFTAAESTDYAISERWPVEDVCAYADRLTGNGHKTR